MSSLESSGLNAGYVGQLLEQYLENPEAVDPAWRALFESGDAELYAALPGLERLVGGRARRAGNGAAAVVAEPPPAPSPPEEIAVAEPAPAPPPGPGR